MLANRLLRPSSRDCDVPIIDLFPERYQVIPDILLTSVCAYVTIYPHHYMETIY